MKKETKCYRCGKIHEINYKNVSEIISCSHCHQQMKITKKSEKRVRFMRYAFVFLVCLVFAIGTYRFTKDNMIILLVVLTAGLLLANVADKVCLVLTYWIFGLEYEEYHEEKRSKKEIRKENIEKNKKKENGFFKRLFKK